MSGRLAFLLLSAVLPLIAGCGDSIESRGTALDLSRAAAAVGIEYGREAERSRSNIAKLLEDEARPDVREALEARLVPAAPPKLAAIREGADGILVTLVGSNAVVGEYSLTFLVDDDDEVRNVTNEGRDARDPGP